MKLLLIAALTYGAFGANCVAGTATNDDGTATTFKFYCITAGGTKGQISGTTTATSSATGVSSCVCMCNKGFTGAGCNTACVNPTVGTTAATCKSAKISDRCIGDTSTLTTATSTASTSSLISTSTVTKFACKADGANTGGWITGGVATACTGSVANCKSGEDKAGECSTAAGNGGKLTCKVPDTGYYAVGTGAALLPTLCTGSVANCKSGEDKAGECSTAAGNAGKLTCKVAADGYYAVGTGPALLPTACKAATAPAATVSCTGAAGAGEKILSCAAANLFTAAVTEISATTTPPTSACTTTATAVVARAAAAATCTACVNQANCKTSSTTACVTTAGLKKWFQCTAIDVNKGYKLDATTKVVSKCAGFAWTATWDATTNCKAATCNVGYSLTSATVFVCSVTNVCKAAAIPAGYAATGIVAKAEVAAVTGSACVDDNKLKVNAIVVALAKDATGVAGLGTVSCATGFTGTAKATCPENGAAKAFKFEGCAKSSAALAQTMIGFVLTIIAMYL